MYLEVVSNEVVLFEDFTMIWRIKKLLSLHLTKFFIEKWKYVRLVLELEICTVGKILRYGEFSEILLFLVSPSISTVAQRDILEKACNYDRWRHWLPDNQIKNNLLC